MKKTAYLIALLMLLGSACSTPPSPIAPTIPIEAAAPIGRAQTRAPSPPSTIAATPSATIKPIPSITSVTAVPAQVIGQTQPPTSIPQFTVYLTLSPSQVIDGNYILLTGPTQVTAFARGAVRVDFFTAPTGTGMTPQLEFADTDGRDGWTWYWQTPRGGSHLWAEAVYANGVRVSSPLLLIMTSEPPPTPTCSTHTAAVQLAPSAQTVQIGQQLIVRVTLLNQGCVALGLPQYTLRAHAPQGQPLFIPPQPESVTHDLAVAPGQSDSVEFVLQGAQVGQGVLQAEVSFEVHIGYPGPAYWGYATSAPNNIAVTSGLKPPDSDQPAAGICGLATDEIVTVTVNPDVPSPRCVQVTGTQRLQVVNATDATVQVTLAQFNVQVQPGQAQLFDAPFGSYLAPGVHLVRVIGGSGPEVWLVGK